MDDYWVWCGSVIKGDDGKYHMFSSRWPKKYPFFNGYVAYSEIVRAVSDTPEGPYEYCESVLPARGSQYWDGRMTHNPSIMKIGEKYVLFYIGSTYQGDDPTPEELAKEDKSIPFWQTRTQYAIGVASADSLTGPWERPEKPILERRPGKWDQAVVTNPAPCLTPDGQVRLYYRSNTPEGLRIGLAQASEYNGKYERVVDEPVISFENGGHIEDPFVWLDNGQYKMLAKDMTGSITGEYHAGIFAYSDDGLTWKTTSTPKAYSRQLKWADGGETVQGSLERPQLIFENGQATHMVFATGDGPGGFHNCLSTWTQILQLA